MKPLHRHESMGINHRRIIGVGVLSAGSLIFLLLLSLALWWLWLRPLPRQAERRIPPTPRLQAHPRADLQALRAHQRQRLNSYGWVDKSAGIAHIPIARAMSLLVAKAATKSTVHSASGASR